jgi:signal transduction histidine kinase
VQRLVDWALFMLRDQEEQGAVQVVDIGETIADHCTAGAYDCRVSFIEAAPAYIVANPVDLTRAVRNLLENALRASNHGGSVEVVVTRDGADAVVEVSDSGPGFGRLAPVHGHGLVGVRRFAERYGGRLHFGSSRLGGAAVTLRLPLALGQPAGVTAQPCAS